MKKRELWYTAGVCKLVQSLRKMEVPQKKLKMELPYDPAISLLSKGIKEQKVYLIIRLTVLN